MARTVASPVSVGAKNQQIAHRVSLDRPELGSVDTTLPWVLYTDPHAKRSKKTIVSSPIKEGVVAGMHDFMRDMCTAHR
jgi:hypothetical protein